MFMSKGLNRPHQECFCFSSKCILDNPEIVSSAVRHIVVKILGKAPPVTTIHWRAYSEGAQSLIKFVKVFRCGVSVPVAEL